MAVATRQPWTADELVRLPAGWRYEIDEGELLIMSPAGWEHSGLTAQVVLVLKNFVDRHRIGEVGGGEAGFRLARGPETLRAADVAYVSAERLAKIGEGTGFPDVPPDMAVEVHDPSEPDLGRKIAQYLAAGVRAVWVLDPPTDTLTRHRLGQDPLVTTDLGATVHEPVLPGFSCRLGDLFGER